MELNKFRQEMADKFIAALKEDRIPWHQEWTSVGRPMNAITEQPYHGSNAFWLSYTAMERNYNDPRWCTFKQAVNNGWQIKKGEKGTRVEFFSFYDKLLKKNITSLEAEKIRIQNLDEYNERIRLVSQTYTVFNGSQIIGIPEYIPEADRNILNADDLISCRDTLIKNMEVGFYELWNDAFHVGARASYSPSMDIICMPEISSFESDYGYMSTFLHEAAHATGAKSRLDRDLTGSFGSKEYAVEELRAEIASAFTAQLTGIPYEQSEFMENHKAYVQSWISVLENNPNELFRAIKDAEKISDYLIEKGELLVAQEIKNSVPTITCEWSESNYFEDGKTYSVYEFDNLMEQADKEWCEARKKEIDTYGEDMEKMWDAYEKGEIDSIHLGYAKVKFHVNMPDGSMEPARQDIGDGDGGVINYFRSIGGYRYDEIASLLEKTKADEEKKINKENDPSVMDRAVNYRHIPISEKAINNRYTEITKEKRETEDALIEGVEFALDNGLSVSKEDWNSYQRIIENRKEEQAENNRQKQKKSGRSR